MKSEKNTRISGGININMDAIENRNDDKERYIKEIVNWHADTKD